MTLALTAAKARLEAERQRLSRPREVVKPPPGLASHVEPRDLAEPRASVRP